MAQFCDKSGSLYKADCDHFYSICGQMVHIGQIIQQAVEKEEIGITVFSKRIGTSRRNAYRIFENPSIDTGLLIKVCLVLRKNFFAYYIPEVDNLLLKKNPDTEAIQRGGYLKPEDIDFFKKISKGVEILLSEREKKKGKKKGG